MSSGSGTNSDQALGGTARLQAMVSEAKADVLAWRGWRLVERPDRAADLRALLREIMFAVCVADGLAAGAGFRMIGRLPPGERDLMQALCRHQADAAARAGADADLYRALGGDPGRLRWPATPAAFAVGAVRERMAAVGDPYGYLGAEYLAATLTECLDAPLDTALSFPGHPRGRRAGGRRENGRRAGGPAPSARLRLLILRTLGKRPATLHAMLHGCAVFRQVYPLPLWDEAYLRALAPGEGA